MQSSIIILYSYNNNTDENKIDKNNTDEINSLVLIGCSEKTSPRIVNLNWDMNDKSMSLGEEQSNS